jgi:uncharacterized membrane protein YfcA
LGAPLLFALLAALLSGCVAGLTGFGFSLVCAPLLLFSYGPETVVVLTAVLSVFVSADVVRDSWREAEWRLAAALLAPALAGSVAGAWVLRAAETEYLELAVGTVVALSALVLLRDARIPGARTGWATVLAGSASGALSTSTGLAGPPVVLLLASRGVPKRPFRATGALYFLAAGAVAFAVLALGGSVDGGALPLAAALVPAAVAGKALGASFVGRISERTFRAASLATVALTGALGVATALRALV